MCVQVEELLEWRGLLGGTLRLDGATGSGERGELVARFNVTGERVVGSNEGQQGGI